MTPISSRNKYLPLGIFIGLILAVAFSLFAFTEPTQAPPLGNVDAPLNAGLAGQSKAGGLIINTGGAANGLIVQSGNVGIGTALINPTGFGTMGEKTFVDISSPGGANGGAYIGLRNPAVTTAAVQGSISFISDVTEVARIEGINDGAADSGYLRFSTTNAGTFSEKMRIDKAGNVGIGTTSQFAVLSVNCRASGACNGIAMGNNNGTGNPKLRIYSQDGIEQHRLDPNGDSFLANGALNVGIGTTNPGQKLTVAGTIESTSGGFRFPDGTTQATAAAAASTPNLQSVTNVGRTTSQNIQSPRFEDYDNSGYYLDPDSSSNLSGNVTASDFYSNAAGRWFSTLSSWLNQSVTTGASPTFNDMYSTASGRWFSTLSSWLNQSVTTGASPTFSSLSAGGTIAGGNVTSGGQNVCRQDGTNCPSFAPGPNSVGTSQLKTGTGSVSGSNWFDVTMNDYSFAPNIQGTGSSGAEVLGPRGGGFAPGTTVGAFQLQPHPLYGGMSATVTWRYITASDNPTIWAIANADGTLAAVWESEDPVHQREPKRLTNPLQGSALEPGQSYVNPAVPSVERIEELFSRFGSEARSKAMKSLQDYVVSRRGWTQAVSKLEDLTRVAERFAPAARLRALRSLADALGFAPAEAYRFFFVLHEGTLRPAANAAQRLTEYQQTQVSGMKAVARDRSAVRSTRQLQEEIDVLRREIDVLKKTVREK